MKVLMVDDEPLVRQFVCAILRLNGFETLEAQDGQEALEIAGQHQCDLVITDWLMPGINGPELVARLKERLYPANYLLISAYAFEEEGSDVPLLSKPFTGAQLMDAIQRLKEGMPGPDELKRGAQEAKAQWLKTIEKQQEILADVPTELPGTDGALLVEKAGLKRKAAYLKYMAALHKHRHSLKWPTQPQSAEPEDSSPEE